MNEVKLLTMTSLGTLPTWFLDEVHLDAPLLDKTPVATGFVVILWGEDELQHHDILIAQD